MEAIPLRLSGLKLIRPRMFRDERGYFLETYRHPAYKELNLPDFLQDNLSFSKKGVIRALHFQLGQAKLIQVLQGRIFDVAVDLRLHSPTFGEWESVELDDQLRYQLFVPAGFAHGFCVLSEDALVHYKASALYDPHTECSIRWNDSDLNIVWPIQQPVLSERDRNSPSFQQVITSQVSR